MQAHLWMARHLLDSGVLLLLVFTVLKIGGENELVKRLAEKKRKKKATHGRSVPGIIYSFMAALHRHF